jgi:hypothetical protein
LSPHRLSGCFSNVGIVGQGVSAREALIYWLRGRIAASRGARKLAYLHDMSRFLRAGLLALHPARRINQRFPSNSSLNHRHKYLMHCFLKRNNGLHFLDIPSYIGISHHGAHDHNSLAVTPALGAKRATGATMSNKVLRLASSHSQFNSFNQWGEQPMPHAPEVCLPNGRHCIPQHYRRYNQTLASLQHIAGDISLPDATLLFADEDDSGLYLQVGLIGRENYERGRQIRPHKLVYGRKWRIDLDTPTSEVIQTAFLAVKLARQHEVRELLTLRVASGKGHSTPFSTHHDLPLMADNRELFAARETPLPMTAKAISSLLENVRFGQRPIQLESVLAHRHRTIIDLQLGLPPLARIQEGDFSEYNHLTVSIELIQLTRAGLMHQLMDALLRESDRQVAEQFRFQGFARFSREIDPLAIAQLSLATRPYSRDMRDARFADTFRKQNYQVDASRAPSLGSGALAQAIRRQLDAFPQLAGHLPMGYLPA